MAVLNYSFFVFFCAIVGAKVLKHDLFPLHIVHYNDFHARFEETSVKYPVCVTNDTDCLGGFARLVQEIRTLMAQYPDALLLNAGDAFQGTYWYTLLKWNVTLKFINMLPNDAHAVGNHEFDDGVAGLVPYFQGLRAPVVAANLDTTNEPTLTGLFKPHIVVERNGRKIGIIGLITTDTKTSSNPRDTNFLDPIPIVEKEAQLLTDQGVDIIIVLSHCGLYVDKEMAKKVGKNIDVIVGGHTHSLLWNGTSPSHEEISGPYPVMVETDNETGHKVLIVTASAFTKYLGNITVYFDDNGDLKSFDGTPIFLNRSIPEDPEIKSLMKPYSERLHQMVAEVVGYSSGEMRARPCGSEECSIGNLIADAILDAGRRANPTNLTSVSMICRNNIRGSLPEGEITRGTVINILPFTNKLVSFELAGRYILEAMNWAITAVWEENPFAGPLMPHVSGLRVTFNVTKPRHVISVDVKEGEDYVPLDVDKIYQISSFSFLKNGGSGFKMLKEHGTNTKPIGSDAVIFEEYLKKVSPITPSHLIQNRLKVVT